MAIAVLILGIAASIGSVVLLGIRDTAPTTAYTSNETTATAVTDARYTYFTNRGCTGVSSCTNQTNGHAIAAVNYTASIPTATDGYCGVTAVEAKFNNSIWYCTYSGENTSSTAYKLANDASIGVGEYGSWFKILVIVAVAAVILGLIFIAFKPKAEASGSY